MSLPCPFRVQVFVSRIVSVTSSASSSPTKSTSLSLQDLKEVRSNVSSLLMNKLRSCSCFSEESLNEEDLLILETFFDTYLSQIFMVSSSTRAIASSSESSAATLTTDAGTKSISSSSSTGHHEANITSFDNNWKWVTSLFRELHDTLSGSMFLMNKCKHLILIPLMKSFHSLINSPSTAFIVDDVDVKATISSMKRLMILLLSFSVSPHEIQLFFSLIAQHRSVLQSSPRHPQSSPMKSISSSPSKDPSACLPGQKTSGERASKDSGPEEDISGEDEEDVFQGNYFSVLTAVLSQPVLSKLPSNFFAFTSYSSLSLPPVKSFPLKGFSFSTHIRLESLSHQMLNLIHHHPHLSHQQQQKQSSSSFPKNDQRMFLFSFKSSSSPPLGFSAFFSQSSITSSSTGVSSSKEQSYVKLTVSCFKGSSSPSLSHTLSFPFPVFQAERTYFPSTTPLHPSLSASSDGQEVTSSPTSSPKKSHASEGNEFIHLTLTFSPTALCLYINGELIESNCNDWSIAGVKAPFPSFDRCFIGCPFVSQVKGSSSLPSNPSDTGFRGQLTSLYLFSSSLSSSAVALLHSLEDPSNACPSFGVNPSLGPPSVMSSVTKGSGKNESELIKTLREINCSLVCLYSPSCVNWPIVLQCVNNNTSSTTSSSNISSHQTSSSTLGRSSQYDINSFYHIQVQVPPISALTSHSLIQGNLEIVQRNLLIDSIQSLNQGLDVILNLLSTFLKEGRVSEFSQLFSFSLDLISNEKNHYFLESAISSHYFKQVLSLLHSVVSSRERCVFLSSPLFLQSLVSILQVMIQDKTKSVSTRRSSSSSGLHHHACHPYGLLQRSMTIKEIESLEMEVDKYKKMRVECVKQILELFILNSFLWSQLLLDEEEGGRQEQSICKRDDGTRSEDEVESKTHPPSSFPRIGNEVSHKRHRDGQITLSERKNREETLTTLYSFISTQLLSLPSSQGILLRRRRRSAFLLQVFNSLKNDFYHQKYPESFMLHDFSHVTEEEKTGSSSQVGSHEQEFLKKLFQEKKSFDRRERLVSLIRSNILVFIKNLLTKASSVSSHHSQSGSSSTSSSSTSSSSTATAVTAGTSVELLESNDNQSESGKTVTASASSSSRIPDHLLDVGSSSGNNITGSSGGGNISNASVGNSSERDRSSSFMDDDDGYFEEETNCILNYLSVTSREILQKDNSCKKSLLNLIDVLSLLNSLIIEIPSSMIPAFDSRKGIYVLFQVINNTIRSSVESESDAEEKEVIRSLCLKILGSFLMRSTYKRKSQSMTSSHFSILYYMLSRDRSILTHSLYVNLMEITIEAPISSLYSLQSNQHHHQQGSNTNANHVPTGGVGSGRSLNQGKDRGSKDLSDDEYWSASCDDRDGDRNERPASASSVKEGSNSSHSASPSSIKIENPQMIKVIALLVVRHKQLANQFLKDLFTLLLDSRSNRRLILQMSVWQSWLISFLKIETNDERERKKREQTVISLFKLLLYHALRWEFGGWRVWIDSLAIIHSFLSREAFNKTFQESSLEGEMKLNRTSRPKNNSSGSNGLVQSEEEEDEKVEHHQIRRDQQQQQQEQQHYEHHHQQSQQHQNVVKKRLSTPTYRIPAFRWSSIHVQLLDSLLSAIITDINCFRKEAMMRANLNGSPTNGDSRETERDTNEALILESILMNSDIYVINIIHLISQLTDSCILDAGGLLPLLAVATSSSSSSSSSSSTTGKRNTSTAQRKNSTTSSPDSPPSPEAASSTIVTTTSNNNTSASQTTSGSRSNNISASICDDDRVDLMNESKATDLLLQLVFLADYLIFNSTLSGSNAASSSAGVSLAELEAEKNMSSGGLLRQILRLVSLVAVKRVLSLKDRDNKKNNSNKTTGATQSSSSSTTKNKEVIEGEHEEDVKTSVVTPDLVAVESDSKDSSSEVDESDDDVDSQDLNGLDIMTENILSRHPKGASKFLARYLEDHDEENDHLLLSVKDIQRLRATLYRSEASNSSSSSVEKEKTNSNFLALSTMYFLSVLLVSKYRDTLDVVSTGSKKSGISSGKENDSSSNQHESKGTSNESDLATMEKSLYPTVQFLKEIISDFEGFLSKSLLGSKGQTLLTKQLVKRIKSTDCSPLEVVMLLCAQEFQNSLQKNAGLAFIELINEGRLLSISMKEHVIRVGIEADFILSRIEREERDRDTLFKRESFLIEEKREKEVDLVQDVVATLSCPGVDLSSLPSSHSSSSRGNNKYRSSKRKSFRDLEEFLSEKRMVLFKEDFMMQERESKCSSSSSSSSSMTTTMRAAGPGGQSSLPGSIIDPAMRSSTQHVSQQTRSSSSSQHIINAGGVSHHSSSCRQEDTVERGMDVNGVGSSPDEVMLLKERVKALMDRMVVLEKERDEAVDELESLKQEKIKSASQSESESEAPSSSTSLTLRGKSSKAMTTVSAASPRGDKKIGLDVESFTQQPTTTVDIICVEQTSCPDEDEDVIRVITQHIHQDLNSEIDLGDSLEEDNTIKTEEAVAEPEVNVATEEVKEDTSCHEIPSDAKTEEVSGAQDKDEEEIIVSPKQVTADQNEKQEGNE